MPNSFSKKLTAHINKLAFLIQKGCHRILQLSRCKSHQIVTQLTTAQLSWCLQFNKNWQIFLASYPGSFSYHYPSSKLIDFFQTNAMISHSPISDVPVKKPLFLQMQIKILLDIRPQKVPRFSPTHFLLFSPLNYRLSI